jgi:hypothetical protein
VPSAYLATALLLFSVRVKIADARGSIRSTATQIHNLYDKLRFFAISYVRMVAFGLALAARRLLVPEISCLRVRVA